MPDYSKTVDEAGLKIKLRPQNYFATNKANSITYKEQRILEVLNATDASPEDRETNLKSITEELIELNVDILTASTEYILTEDGAKVIDGAFIKEFYSNTSSANIRRVQERLAEIGKDAGLKPYNSTCEECKHEYKTEVTFDYANFFANGS